MRRALLIALALVVLAGCGGTASKPDAKTYVVVPGPAMEPTFVKGDRLLVHPKDGSDVKVGDIVWFDSPAGWLGEGQQPGHLLKRVLGVGGDEVSCSPAKKDGKLVINGKPVDETAYLPKGTAPCDYPFDVTVPSDSLWVMGDNRPNSADSRAHLAEPDHGFVPVSSVEGVVLP